MKVPDYTQRYEDFLDNKLEQVTLQEGITFEILNFLEGHDKLAAAFECISWNDMQSILAECMDIVDDCLAQIELLADDSDENDANAD